MLLEGISGGRISEQSTDGQGAICGRRLGSNTRRQASSRALQIAPPRITDTGRRVGMGAFAQTAVHAVQGALDGHVRIAFVDLAIITLELWVANTSPVFAIAGRPTIVGADFCSAVEPAEPWLTPASSVQTQPIVRAVVDANGNRAIWAVVVRDTLASPVDTNAVAVAVRGARLQIAAWASPPILTHAHIVATNPSRLAVVRAPHNRAVNAGRAIRTVTSAVVAIAVTAAVVRAGQQGAVWTSVRPITNTFGLDAHPV